MYIQYIIGDDISKIQACQENDWVFTGNSLVNKSEKVKSFLFNN